MHHLKSCVVLAFLFLSCVFANVSAAQSGSTSFSVDVVSVKSDSGEGESRLDLYTSLPYSNLRFLKEGEFFNANYDLTVEIFYFAEGEKRPQLVEKEVWGESVEVADFATTHSSSHLSFSNKSFDLLPGRYRLKVVVEDKATLESFSTEFPAELKAFDSEVTVSDLILVDGYSEAFQSITPKVGSQVFDDESSFKVFYELYASEQEAVNVQFQLIRTANSRGLPVLRWISKLWQSNNVQENITYENSRLITIPEGRLPRLVEIPLEGFEVGEYMLRAIVQDGEGTPLDVSERMITLKRSDRAEFEGRDIDAAIAQLRYVAKPKELKEIRNAKTKKEREERFMAFWEKRDPTPDTPENEHMEEYYLRIDFANRRYTGSNSGWETDRGETLVLYGEPDQVDRSSLAVEISQPFEVWYYNRINRRFIFVDRSGGGQFELIKTMW